MLGKHSNHLHDDRFVQQSEGGKECGRQKAKSRKRELNEKSKIFGIIATLRNMQSQSHIANPQLRFSLALSLTRYTLFR